MLAQRVQNSTLPEKERDFFINALIFRTPQNLYGKTIKQIIEEEQLIADQAKRLENILLVLNVSFPDGRKIPTERTNPNSLFERYSTIQNTFSKNNTCKIYLTIDDKINLFENIDFSTLAAKKQEMLISTEIKQLCLSNPDIKVISSGFINLEKNNVLLITYKEHYQKEEKFFKAHLLYNQKLFTFTTLTTDKTDKHLLQFIEILKSFKPLYSLDDSYEQTH